MEGQGTPSSKLFAVLPPFVLPPSFSLCGCCIAAGADCNGLPDSFAPITDPKRVFCFSANRRRTTSSTVRSNQTAGQTCPGFVQRACHPAGRKQKPAPPLTVLYRALPLRCPERPFIKSPASAAAADCFRQVWEPLFNQAGVDIALSGHVHACEPRFRSTCEQNLHPVPSKTRHLFAPYSFVIGARPVGWHAVWRLCSAKQRSL